MRGLAERMCFVAALRMDQISHASSACACPGALAIRNAVDLMWNVCM